MNQEVAVKTPEGKPSKGQRWFAGYVVAGIIWTLAKNNGFDKTSYDGLIIAVIAILCGVFYHRLKSKIKGKEWLRVIGTFLILEIIAAILIGFFTGLANNWQAIAVRTPLGSQIATADGAQMKKLNNDLKAYEADFQTKSNQIQGSIDEQANSDAGYQNNITGYRELQKLTDERYARFALYAHQFNPILTKYSQDLSDAFSGLATASVNTQNAADDLFIAKINYYQALLDGKSSVEAGAARSAANDAVNKYNQVQQAGAQALQNWQTAYDAFFGSKEVDQKSSTAPTQTFNYDAFINDALSNLQTKQANLETILSPSKYSSYKYSALLGQLVFTDLSTNDKLVAEVQDIGGLAPNKEGKETWMWSWANNSVPADMVKDSLRVKQFGVNHDQEIRNAPTNKALLGRNPLTESIFISDDTDALDFAAATLYLADGKGIYKAPFTNANGNAVEYFLIKKISAR